MFDITIATSASALEQLKKNYYDTWEGAYKISEIYNLWYYTNNVKDPLIPCTAYYQYNKTNYWSASFNYSPVTGLYYYNKGSGNSATADNNGLTKEALSSQTLFYSSSEESSPSCFNEGTKILCLNKNFEEEYIPIENLKKGDLVKSYKHGYRKIDLIGKNNMINNPDKFEQCMYQLSKNEKNGLLEDLIVTGGHSILVDDLGDHKEENDKIFTETLKIDDKYLLLACVSKDFFKLENNNLYVYYHLILENNENDEERFLIWANNVLTETPSKTQFMSHNYILL